MRDVFTLSVLAAICFGSSCTSSPRVPAAAGDVHHTRSGPQVPLEPELVQPGLISTDGEETFPAIDPVDGSLWFSMYEGESWNRQTIMRAPREGSGWGAPVAVFPEGDEWRGRAPRFSPDGKRLYFTSNRSVAAGGERADMNIWVLERSGAGWSEPRVLPEPVNSDKSDIHVVETANGDLYLASRRMGSMGESDIYRIPRNGDEWGPAEHLAAPLNDERSQPDLLVAPDGSWMILVVTDHPQGLGADDLFLVRQVGGRWGAPEHLPAPINSAEYEYGPTLSPDGATLYFTSQRRGSADVYRIPLSALGIDRR